MKVELRVLQESDREILATLMNNKKIWDNLKDYIPHPYHIEDADFFIDLTQKQIPSQSFAIVNEQSELCGVISLIKQDDIYRLTAELGYWIGEPYWGRGIATQAIELITDYGFKELKLERIYAGVFDFNKASRKVLEKNGYQLEGILRNAIVKNAIIRDEYRYAKLKNEQH